MTPVAAGAGVWLHLASDWQHLAQDWLQWWWSQAARAALPARDTGTAPPPIPLRTAEPVAPLIDPAALTEITERYQRRFAEVWRDIALAAPGDTPAPERMPAAAGDRRFAAPEWRDIRFFALLREIYLLYSEYLRTLVEHADLPDAERKRLAFVTRQYLDAIAPTNFPGTNPEVVKRALATEGRSLVAGLSNLRADLKRGRITMSDESAFAVGRNLAVTPGSVVYRNELIEVLQYAPTTPRVHARPLLIVPPCINKYYILDLQPANSFVRHVVSQGHTVFLISWRNVSPKLSGLQWDDYLRDGVLKAAEVACEVADSRTLNTLGFCVGGTLLACALAVLAARGNDSVASATFLTTMLDFADPGDIGVYLDRASFARRETDFLSGARMKGGELAGAFASLRANDLVWNYVVNNYLKGETPPAFDLLYWNGDSANLPGPMYAHYLRNMYLDNRLREPGALSMLGERIDLRRIKMPAYVLASREDHIVPWRSAYRTTALVGGDVTFVLAASGHIAGVVNPPVPPRRSHWVNELVTDDPDDWYARAEQVPGSWWPHWTEWLARHAGKLRAAPAAPGSAAHPPLDPAPGRYVKEAVA